MTVPLRWPAVTLTEFLLARIAEDEAVERDAYLYQGIPEGDRDGARPYMERTLFYAMSEFRSAALQCGWAIVSIVPALARRRAARYADHPDYREEWKP